MVGLSVGLLEGGFDLVGKGLGAGEGESDVGLSVGLLEGGSDGLLEGGFDLAYGSMVLAII